MGAFSGPAASGRAFQAASQPARVQAVTSGWGWTTPTDWHAESFWTATVLNPTRVFRSLAPRLWPPISAPARRARRWRWRPSSRGRT